MAASGPRRRSISRRLRLTHRGEESTAAGIHGVIVSAAVMAAAHAATAAALVTAVLVTLVIYWSAERYSRLVAERIHRGHRPGWDEVRRHLSTGWESVVAPVPPLAVLVVLRLLGYDLSVAVTSALVCSTALLCLAGWEIGRGGRLTRRERLVSAAVAGLFGVALIVLKTVPH